MELYKLQSLCRVEISILEQGIDLILGLDHELLGLVASTKDIDEPLVVPLVDVVIRRVHAVNKSFNSKALVADNETASWLVTEMPGHTKGVDLHDRLEIVTDHGADFLSS